MNLIIKNIIVILGKGFFIFKNKKIPKNPKKILIMRSGGIGDVIMSTPLIKAIKNHYKNAEITYFVGNWSKAVLKDNPNIDNLFTYDDLIIVNMNIPGILKMIKQIRKEKFDMIFNLEKSWHWVILSFLFKIKTRVGFDRKGEGFANNLTAKFDGSKYELEYYLDLAELCKITPKTKNMEVYLTKQEKQTATNFIKNNKLNNIIGIAPGGADNPAQQAFIKRWPVENYIELINKLKNKQFILFGGKNDIATCNKIKQKTKNTISTAGKLTLKQSAALMQKCKLIITHDSGPMHLAATKTKVIALFGPTQAERFAPKNAITITSKSCKSCYTIYGEFKDCKSKKCMKSIKVRHVLSTVNKN